MPQLQVELSNLPVVREGGISRQPLPQLNKQFIDLAALDLVKLHKHQLSKIFLYQKTSAKIFLYLVISKALVSDKLPPCKLHSKIWFTFNVGKKQWCYFDG